MNTLEKRVQNTIAYHESDKGKINWQLNASRGYTDYMNTVAAIMTATHLIKYERIVEVLEAVRSIELVKGAA